MSPTIRDAGQADLLAWSPPTPVRAFDPARVRAITLAGKIKRAIAEALRHAADDGVAREQIVAAMADYLSVDVSKNAVDAWASEAREENLPNIVRFVALMKATKDQRLLQVLADQCGWAVVDKKFLPLIELASLREHQDVVKRRADELRAVSRSTGAL